MLDRSTDPSASSHGQSISREGIAHFSPVAFAIQVLAIQGDHIPEINNFIEKSPFQSFYLPSELRI